MQTNGTPSYLLQLLFPQLFFAKTCATTLADRRTARTVRGNSSEEA
jgi:hypothetical protein